MHSMMRQVLYHLELRPPHLQQHINITITAFILAEAILSSQEIQSSIQVSVDLVDAVPDGLQRHSPVGGLRLLALDRLRLHPHQTAGHEQQQEGPAHRQPRTFSRQRSRTPPIWEFENVRNWG